MYYNVVLVVDDSDEYDEDYDCLCLSSSSLIYVFSCGSIVVVIN